MNEQKKLHIVHTESAIGWGGKEIRVLSESKGMMDRGHQVTLICDPRSAIFAQAQKDQIPTRPLPIEKKSWKGICALRRFFRDTPSISVINTHSSADSWMSILACQSLFNAPPIVRTRHVSSLIANNAIARWQYTKACKHLAITGEAVRQQLHQECAIPLTHMTSVPTGIDLDYFKPNANHAFREQLGISPDTIVVGILAALRSWKGQRTLIEAISKVVTTHDDVLLILVGDGPIRPSLEEFASQCQISHKVKFVGHQTNTADWLNLFDIFALPSYANEGVPQGLMQAMACALPCISTPIGGIPDILQHQKTGLMVPPQDPDALSQAILTLIHDADLRQQLASHAQQAAQAFSLTHMLDKMEHIFYQYAR